MKYVFIQVLPPFLLLSSQKQEEIKRIKLKNLMRLPQDNSLDAIFTRMLEKILHLGEIEKIFSKFDTAVIKNKVENTK
jgi:hypothetical protein